MAKLTLADISDLREYEREREEFRREVIALKRLRRIGIGPLLTVVFENAMTMRFQIQEMARVEKIITDAALEDELAIYNPLVPEPGELSVTLFVELANDAELREWLPKLVGIERSMGLRIGDGSSALIVRGIVDADHESQLTRDDVTAAVHYVKFTLDGPAQVRFATEATLLFADHPAYQYETLLIAATKHSLVADWSDR